MKNAPPFKIQSQPNDTTCGPTCLQAVYQYFGDQMDLSQVIAEIPALDEGGTLAVMLGCHALRRGYQATIYTYNLKVFDPTWFSGRRRLNNGMNLDLDWAGRSSELAGDGRRGELLLPAGTETSVAKDLVLLLEAQTLVKESVKLQIACRAYGEFIKLGGAVEMHDLNADLIRYYLDQNIPILTGLSATYLYRCKREIGRNCKPDDIRGVPTGHFVVLCGYEPETNRVQVADPYRANPLGEENYYEVHVERLICAILLGVITYDANLLIIQPRRE